MRSRRRRRREGMGGAKELKRRKEKARSLHLCSVLHL